jgi:myo-inositol-1(or 4)-monophosphatase
VDLERLRDLALRAARAGGEVVSGWHARGRALGTQRKGIGDYVTDADRAAEGAILKVLRREAPDIEVLAEESGGATGGDQPFWAVDPIDGTTNFLRGFPVVGISVGLMHAGRPLAGAVCAPLLGQAWCAARGLGAQDVEGRALRVREEDGQHSRGVVATGFPFRRPELRARYLPVLDRAITGFEDLRRAGAAALDLAYAAQGSFDGFFELNLSLWDIAAGALLVTEAGGVVTDWEGDAGAVYTTGDILAGSPQWHARMLAMTTGAPT